MGYLVLARKWRPHKFSQVIGQDHVVTALTNALTNDRMHHAYLFTGTRGVGKTTIARILAKALNCENRVDFDPCDRCSVCQDIDAGRYVDLIEVDAASRTKVEDTRELLDNVQYAPAKGRFKVYLIDEVHMLSGHSFNALLKTLEEPPPHVKFLLATTDPQKIPVTVLSRCIQFNLKSLQPTEIAKQINVILADEKIECDEQSLNLLADAAQGSMRDGLSLLDQAIVSCGGPITGDKVNLMLGAVAGQAVMELLEYLHSSDAAGMLDKIDEMANYCPDFANLLQQILSNLHKIALIQAVPNLDREHPDSKALSELATRMSPEDVQLYYQIGLIGQRDLKWAPDPQSGFEMILLRMLAFKPVAESNTNMEKCSPLQGRPGSGPQVKHGAVAQEVPANAISNGRIENPESKTCVKSSWFEIVAAMGITGMARELANNSVLRSIDDKVCTLSLNSGHEQLRSKRVEDRLQSALQAYYEKPLKLVIKVGEGVGETPAMMLSKQRKQRQSRAETDITEDANVRALAEAFEAKIVPGSTEPLGND